MNNASIVERVNAFINAYLSEDRERLTKAVPQGTDFLDLAQHYVLAGGKRLRAQFCYWGYVAADGDPQNNDVVHAAAALELLHAFALIHDDIMDGAQSRRDLPTPHVVLSQRHQSDALRGESRRYGEGVAMLLGDLLFVYAQLLAAELNDEARAVWARLTSELVMGQYLDMETSAQGIYEEEVSLAIAQYKSGKYSVERPLQLGSAVAGAGDKFNDAWSTFGVPLGEAFQLRDDLLGIIGDPTVTGKPVGDDLREGKPTYIVAVARTEANATQQAVLDRIGEPSLDSAAINAITDVLKATGAISQTEQEIARRLEMARAALEAMTMNKDARQALELLATAATSRNA